jgi:hypothetical protein
MSLTLTNHARVRIIERCITDDELAAALAGREVEDTFATYHYDNGTRTLLVTDNGLVVTAFRATKRWVKVMLSR